MERARVWNEKAQMFVNGYILMKIDTRTRTNLTILTANFFFFVKLILCKYEWQYLKELWTYGRKYEDKYVPIPNGSSGTCRIKKSASWEWKFLSSRVSK